MTLYVSNSPVSCGKCACTSWSSVVDLLVAGLNQSSCKCVVVPLASAKTASVYSLQKT